jgi:hypothetical protein
MQRVGCDVVTELRLEMQMRAVCNCLAGGQGRQQLQCTCTTAFVQYTHGACTNAVSSW